MTKLYRVVDDSGSVKYLIGDSHTQKTSVGTWIEVRESIASHLKYDRKHYRQEVRQPGRAWVINNRTITLQDVNG